MLLKLHRWIACVLLVLLPLQATAMRSHCPNAPTATAESQAAPAPAADHCLHEHAGGHDPSRNNDHKPGCAAMSACALCATAVNVSQAFKTDAVREQPVNIISAQYSSFIPEGPLRPPSILA